MSRASGAAPGGGGRSRRRRRIPGGRRRRSALADVGCGPGVAGLIFRKAIAWLVIAALSGSLHLVGLNVHLPNLKFAWPWQSISAGSSTDVAVGPWVLQSIEGISKPALGTENFTFTFTHKVNKSIGFWPCWYSSTFAASGRASATVDLNPGSGWWAPATGHFVLQVLSKPAGGRRDGRGHPGPAAAAAPAVRTRHHRGRHLLASDRHAAQLDVSGARLRRADQAAVRADGALRPGAESRLPPGHT